MSYYSLFLVLASSVGWAIFDVSRKKLSLRFDPLKTLFVFMFCSLPMLVLWLNFSDLNIKSSYWGIGLFAVLINFLANWTFIESVHRSPISQTVPMLSFVPVFSSLLSMLWLGEQLSSIQFVGIGFVVLGALLLNGVPSFKDKNLGPLLMFLASIFWSLMLVIDKVSLRSTSPAVHIFIQTNGILVLTYLLMKFKKIPLELFSSIKSGGFYLWFGILGCVAGAGLQLVAISDVHVGVLESVKRASNMSLAFLSGMVFFGETLTARRWLALIVLLCGTFMVLEVL